MYPIQLVRPIGKYRVDAQEYLDDFLTDTCVNRLIIQAFVGDSPKRTDARFCKGAGAYYPCEYCECKGHLLNTQDSSVTERRNELQRQKNNIEEQLQIAQENNAEEHVLIFESVLKNVNESIKALKKKNSNIVWPASTKHGPRRTAEKIHEISDKINNNENLTNDECKGIVGRSLFLDIPYFDPVLDYPCEYLHSVCLGVGKRLIILTFNVGETRQRNTKRKLSDVAQFNKEMSKVKVVREYSRRARNLDFSVMKEQEYCNIIIVFFLIVLNCIEKGEPERKVWLLFAFMVRACVLPENEYETIDSSIIQFCSYNFYDLYEEIFHPCNCTYYTHIVGAHMEDMRTHGPLTLTSAFGFESFFGEMRHSFTPGTCAPLKQIMETIYLKRNIATHSCEQPIFFSQKDSPMECNSLIYTFVESEYNFYKIRSMENDIFECSKVAKKQTSFPETPTLNWGSIGVFENGEIEEEVVHISRKSVAGKVLKVNNLLLTCPNNVLREK